MTWEAMRSSHPGKKKAPGLATGGPPRLVEPAASAYRLLAASFSTWL